MQEFLVGNHDTCVEISCFDTLVNSIREAYPSTLVHISFASAMTKTYSGIQRQISQILQDKLQSELNRLVTERGNAQDRVLVRGKRNRVDEVMVQHIANKDFLANAYLTANSADKLCQLSNDSMTLAVQTTLCLPINDTRKYCLCGELVGPLFAHAARCGTKLIAAKLRNTLHANLRKSLAIILQKTFEEQGLRSSVAKEEPQLVNYFQQLPDDVRPPGNGKDRADICINDPRGN